MYEIDELRKRSHVCNNFFNFIIFSSIERNLLNKKKMF